MQDINSINLSMIQQSQIKPDPSPHKLEKYKKKLLVQVIGIFVICLFIILERVFYEVIVSSEEEILAKLQRDTSLTEEVTDDIGNTKVQPDQITQPFLKFYGMLSQFRIQFLITTHLLASFYVGVNCILASKLFYVTMATIYLISLLQIFYGGGRPFWQTNTILSSDCLASYNHPSLGLILLVVLPAYTYYCLYNKINKSLLREIPGKHLIGWIVFFVVVGTIQFMNYYLGGMFVINIAISLIFSLLLIMILATVNSSIDSVVKKSTIIKVDAKKYVFYWLLIICLLETIMLITYSGQDLFLDIDWVQNFMNCTRYLQYPQKTYQYDEIIGPWFNFVQSGCIFAWIGGVFGISACFSNLDNFEWSSGTNAKRLQRVIIANIMIIPSWIFVLLLQNRGNWIENIGLNEFIIDGIHFFILYIWIFGYMPIIVLHKLLKLTHRQADDQYFILTENKLEEKEDDGKRQ